MATKTEIKKLLQEIGHTEKEMDSFWNDCIGTNWKIKNLNDYGKTWRDLNVFVIKELPTQKQKDLEYAEKQRIEEEKRKLQEQKEKEEKEYYMNNFEEIIVNKIDANEKLTESELSSLIWEYKVETEKGENRRWSRTNTTIVKLLDRYFSINWEEGLTEMQPNEFYEQPYEVKLEEYEKTITVRNWVKV